MCAKSDAATRFFEFCFNHLLEVTEGQKKKFQKRKKIYGIFKVLNTVENGYTISLKKQRNGFLSDSGITCVKKHLVEKRWKQGVLGFE